MGNTMVKSIKGHMTRVWWSMWYKVMMNTVRNSIYYLLYVYHNMYK